MSELQATLGEDYHNIRVRLRRVVIARSSHLPAIVHNCNKFAKRFAKSVRPKMAKRDVCIRLLSCMP